VKRQELAELEGQREQARRVVRNLALGQGGPQDFQLLFFPEAKLTPGEVEAVDQVRTAKVLPVDRDWLAKRLDISKDAAAIRLARAAAKGFLVREKRGLYRPAPVNTPRPVPPVEMDEEPTFDVTDVSLGEEAPV